MATKKNDAWISLVLPASLRRKVKIAAAKADMTVFAYVREILEREVGTRPRSRD